MGFTGRYRHLTKLTAPGKVIYKAAFAHVTAADEGEFRNRFIGAFIYRNIAADVVGRFNMHAAKMHNTC